MTGAGRLNQIKAALQQAHKPLDLENLMATLLGSLILSLYYLSVNFPLLPTTFHLVYLSFQVA